MNESNNVGMLRNADNKQVLYAINFMNYVELIKNPSIQHFTREVLVNYSPNYFWTTSASKSGKYHNADECEKSGLLLHIKRAINMSLVLMRGLGWYDHMGSTVKVEKEEDYDVVLSAIILHDLLTAGFEGREKKNGCDLSTDNLHPYYVREHLRMKKINYQNEEIYMYKLPFFDKIMKAIEGHYGYWSVMPHTANLENAQSNEFIVYMADYIASRKLDTWFNIS
ncbi:MAG: hypothetical protein M0Q13_02485 [Methanothrix sp.]|nr:hypothetical protein [Methanothrix sp.]